MPAMPTQRAARLAVLCAALAIAALLLYSAVAHTVAAARRPLDGRARLRHGFAQHGAAHSGCTGPGAAGRGCAGGAAELLSSRRSARRGAAANSQPKWQEWFWGSSMQQTAQTTDGTRGTGRHGSRTASHWTDRVGLYSARIVHAWAHASAALATRDVGTAHPEFGRARMSAMHDEPGAGAMRAQRRRLQQGAAAGAVTVVVTAQELQEAVARGDTHIEVRRHLDLSPLAPRRGVAVTGFETLALGQLPASVKSLRVRVPSIHSMHSMPSTHSTIKALTPHSTHVVPSMRSTHSTHKCIADVRPPSLRAVRVVRAVRIQWQKACDAAAAMCRATAQAMHL